MITWLDGLELRLATRARATFPYVIKSAAVCGSDAVIVLLEPPRGTATTPSARDQVYCIDLEGKTRWRIQSDPDLSGYFTGIVSADADALVVFDWDCFAVQLDPTTGKILRKTFTK
jgi:hypothetical protein